jgi:hypothetical protein
MTRWIMGFFAATVKSLGWGVFAALCFGCAFVTVDHAYSRRSSRVRMDTRASAPAPAPAREAKPTYWETTIIIRAYCPCARCCGWHSPGITATTHRIHQQDYIIAVSPDLEEWIKVDNDTRLFVPLYNKPGTSSMANDRTKQNRHRQIEVLMTVSKRINGRLYSPHRRALLWGHKYATLRVWSDGRREIVDVRRDR